MWVSCWLGRLLERGMLVLILSNLVLSNWRMHLLDVGLSKKYLPKIQRRMKVSL